MSSNLSHMMLSAYLIRDPVEPFGPADEMFHFTQLTRVYDEAGKIGHILSGGPVHQL